MINSGNGGQRSARCCLLAPSGPRSPTSSLPRWSAKCYRGSALASAAVASTYAFHRAIRTWEAAVDVFLVGSEFARHKLIEAGLPADRIVTKPNTAPDPGSSRSALGRNY